MWTFIKYVFIPSLIGAVTVVILAFTFYGNDVEDSEDE